MSEVISEGAGGGARVEGADRIASLRGEGPGLLSRLPGMAYQCRNDPEWTMEFVSEGCRSLTGHEPEEMVGPRGIAYADVIHPDDRERVWEEVQRAISSSEPSFELQYRIVTAEGDIRDVWERGHPVRSEDGELLGLEGFITDITELEHTRKELARSEGMVRSLVEQALVGVYVIQDGLFQYVNPAFANIFGYRVDEIEGRLGPMDLTVEEDQETVQTQIRRRLEGDERSIRYEFSGLRKDGSAIRVEVHGSAMELDGDEAIAGVLIDVTERRALEEQLRHAQRVEGLGELTGAIAHDFNNYLTAILAPIDLVLQEVDDDSPFRPELFQARQTAQQAASLTRQLLSFGRKRVHSPRPLYLNGVLENLRGTLDRVTGERVDLTYELDLQLPAIVADPSHLQQVLLNLVVNARDAMPDGGRILVETRTETVERTGSRRWNDLEPGSYVALSVRDDGYGMDRETVKRVFDPYFTTKETGTGLGLSTVFGIVKQHGGGIRAESAPGEGTEFTILFPVTERTPMSQDAGASEFRRSAAEEDVRGTILVVEDEEAVRRVTVAALRRFGYTVLDAKDGESALRAERSHGPAFDLLLTDMGLPDTNGAELAGAIRDRRPDLPILLMSGYGPQEMLRDPAEGPDFHFLEKPFVIDELLEAVARVLESARSRGDRAAG